MKVKATQRGYIGGVLYDIGNVFEISGAEELGSWMSVVEEAPKPKAKAKAKKSKAEKVEAEEE